MSSIISILKKYDIKYKINKKYIHDFLCHYIINNKIYIQSDIFQNINLIDEFYNMYNEIKIECLKYLLHVEIFHMVMCIMMIKFLIILTPTI